MTQTSKVNVLEDYRVAPPSESSSGFDHLTGNHSRDTDEFYTLVPQMPPVITNVSGALVAPLLALQVTLFPNVGGDAALLKDDQLLPLYDRTVIKDPKGLEEIFWRQLQDLKFEVSPFHFLPTNKVRATFIIRQVDVKQLKKSVSTSRPMLPYVSTFTLACAYVWSCMMKSRLGNGEEIDEDDLDFFICSVDCRPRVNPPLRTTYFGNCIAPVFVKAKTTQLLGEEGFFMAAELIGEAIHNKQHNEEGGGGVLNGIENWFSEVEVLKLGRIVSVAGSPKMGFYSIDFGWGGPKKIEILSIDVTEGDLEVGVSLRKIKMDAFASIFADGIKNL
ncbi:unnamed protein product [Ilex paraguariensis]|uniref:Uncharacterized protein n=1 Tax=Ilex paraguariensis TaxID=185542 RepID=A0ABC8U094_9AQUA